MTRSSPQLHILLFCALCSAHCVTNDVPAAPPEQDMRMERFDMPGDMESHQDQDVPGSDADMMSPADMPDLTIKEMGQPLDMDMHDEDMSDLLDMLPDAMPDMPDMSQPLDMGPCQGMCSAREVCEQGSCVDVCDVQMATCGEVMHQGVPVVCGDCVGVEQGCVDNQCVDLCSGSGAECGDVTWSGDTASCGVCMGVDESCVDAVCQVNGRWRQVAAGRSHTCAINNAGKVWCWGSNEQGQLGHPQTSMRALSPVETVNLATISQLDIADQHTCVVDLSGLAWCWGDNTHGQIGNGQQIDRTSPYRITSLSNVARMTTGSWHTCAQLSDRSVRCVGYGQQGQVGDGSTNNSTAFRAVRDLSEGVLFVDAGPAHNCVTTTTGEVKCWGFNGVTGAYGRLGVGDTQSRVEPTLTMSFGLAHQVSSGEEHSCAVTQAGEVWCWGDNTFGQLGDGGSSDRLNPQQVPGLSDVRRVTAGKSHSCAVTFAGDLYCWGRNDNGQLGVDSLNVQRSPQLVSVPGDVISVHAGYQHTCAITRTGDLYCWGDNASGQLGLGDLTRRQVPTLVP